LGIGASPEPSPEKIQQPEEERAFQHSFRVKNQAKEKKLKTK
jgi:hypothetical protein